MANTKSDKTRLGWLCYFDAPSDIALFRINRAVNYGQVPAPSRMTLRWVVKYSLLARQRASGWTISNGIVSSLRKSKGLNLVQFTAPVSNGSSGYDHFLMPKAN